MKLSADSLQYRAILVCSMLVFGCSGAATSSSGGNAVSSAGRHVTPLLPLPGDLDADELGELRLRTSDIEFASDAQFVGGQRHALRQELLASFHAWRANHAATCPRERSTNGGAPEGESSNSARTRSSQPHQPVSVSVPGPPLPPPEPARRGDISITAGLARVGSRLPDGMNGFGVTALDGRIEYSIREGKVRIASVDSRQEVTTLAFLAARLRGVFVHAKRLVVFADVDRFERGACIVGYDCVPGGTDSSTLIEIYDVTDPTQPQRRRTLKLSGSLLGARLVANTLHTVFSQGDATNKNYRRWPFGLESCGTSPEVAEGQFRALINDLGSVSSSDRFLNRPRVTENSKRFLGVRRVFVADEWGPVFTSIVSFDITNDDLAANLTSIKSAPNYVYLSERSLYFAELQRRGGGDGVWHGHYPRTEEVTVIHKFHLGDHPSRAKYTSVGLVPGYLMGQTPMREREGALETTANLYDARANRSTVEVSRLRETPYRVLVRVDVKAP